MVLHASPSCDVIERQYLLSVAVLGQRLPLSVQRHIKNASVHHSCAHWLIGDDRSLHKRLTAGTASCALQRSKHGTTFALWRRSDSPDGTVNPFSHYPD